MNTVRQSCQLLAKVKPKMISFSRSISTVKILRSDVASASVSVHHQRFPPIARHLSFPFSQRKRTFASDTNNPLSKEHFDMLVNNNKVVIFMKGVPDEPRCGFSNAVVQILRMHGVTGYDSHDVLQDENLRQGIKDYSGWPTIPQVFINGDFIGGCDILIEMHKNGELVQQLSKAGIKSALLDKESNGK